MAWPLLPKVGGIPILPGMPVHLAFTQGNVYHVKPYTGSDGDTGLNPNNALKTVLAAYNKCTANRNDIVRFYGEGNSADYCSDRIATTFTWAKDCTHLIGINSGVSVSPRSRIAFKSTYATASNLFTLSASGCYFAHLNFFAGVASTNPTGCLKVTGARNRFERCHIAGIGASTNDIASAYSLMLDAAQENEFDHCRIGLFTIGRGAQLNSEILFDGAAKENTFANCAIVSQMTHASNHVLVEVVDATGVDAFNYFEGCKFLYQSANYAVGATGVFRLPALTQGYFLVENCVARSDASATTIKWDVNDRNKLVVFGPVMPADDNPNLGRLI